MEPGVEKLRPSTQRDKEMSEKKIMEKADKGYSQWSEYHGQ